MKKITRLLMTSLVLLALFSYSDGKYLHSKNTVSSAQTLDSETKGKIIEELASLIEENYVFADVAQKIAGVIRSKHDNKAYDPVGTPSEFLQKLTEDLRAVNNDSHLGVIPRRGPVKQGVSPEEMYKAMFIKRGPFQNYGFKKVERLLGNVGCLVLDELSYVEVDGKNVGGHTAKAAMQMLSNSDALIIDLRDNFGGREEMALLLLDYLFEKPTHLLNNRYRGRKDVGIWTPGEMAGGRLAEIPVFVLTSRHTVSGGEMIAYVLKNRKRATIIGEKSRGSAHRTHLFSLESGKIDAAIPVGTTIDPETRTDWEGKGVEPDMDVPSGQAMDVAYKKALETLVQSDAEPSKRYEIAWALMEVDARLNPVSLDESALREYTGDFGNRKIFVKDGALHYQREGRPAYELEPMTKDMFSFVDKGMFYVRVRFSRSQSGDVDTMILVYDTGQKDEILKK
jgi:hypothetical protein